MGRHQTKSTLTSSTCNASSICCHKIQSESRESDGYAAVCDCRNCWKSSIVVSASFDALLLAFAPPFLRGFFSEWLGPALAADALIDDRLSAPPDPEFPTMDCSVGSSNDVSMPSGSLNTFFVLHDSILA